MSEAGVLSVLVLLLLACGGTHRSSSGEHVGFNPGPTPPELHHGEVLFNSYCISCHGRHGTGEGLGPPLLDTLYRPRTLTDDAIYVAVERGATQRHWSFGAMPPVHRMSRDEIREVIGYLRWVQERVGLDDAEPASTMEAK